MPAPQCASCHKARAALRRPRSGQALCGACFCAALEAEVLHTVVAGRLLPPVAVVAVGASGGKDSTVLAHVLRELAPSLGISLHLVAVDEGIGGYRDAARACCTFCGVLRRRALEEVARLVGATHVVTGHNADDKAETVLMNFLRGDAGRLARGGGLGSPGEGGALLRCRPLQLASQKEVVLYAHFRRLDYFSEECVYAPEAFRGHARDLLKMLEAKRPSAVLDLVHSAERLALAPAARRLLPLRGAGQPRALPGLRAPGRPEPRPAPPGHRQGPPGAGRGGAAAGAAAVPTADFPVGPRLL
ncbi:unnamed protein product, partial [Rangifer tarandus platyrhynchus]|uniref:Uncharacterized protein n=1 Tax=Rangifer tarandus platyrhynchus TaxID=3082113 RepID=A0AC59YSS3_RANTA